MKAADVMSTGAATVQSDAALADAARLMVEHRISGLPVVDGQDKLVGVITENDFLRAGSGQKPLLIEFLDGPVKDAANALSSRKVAELMSKDPVTVGVDTPVQEIAALMTDRAIRRVPVVSNGKVVGIVSRANLLLALLRHSQSDADPRRGRA
jgi:CBS domain-containing protein